MGKLIDQFKPKQSYNYGCNNYNPSININQSNNNNISNNNNSNNNNLPNRGRTPEAAFMGYDGPTKMYGLHMWDGNYN
jgi:hypothetical protein